MLNSDVMFIKTLMGREFPSYMKQAQIGKYTDNPPSSFVAGCKAILDNDSTQLREIVKVASHYRVASDIYRFGAKLKNYVEKKSTLVPLTNKQEILDADRNFSKNYTTYDTSMRTKMASQIFNAAKEYNVSPISAHTVAYATGDIPLAYNRKEAGLNIGLRATTTNNPQHQIAYIKLGRLLQVEKLPTGDVMKVAHIIENLDRANGVRYDTLTKNRYNESLKFSPPLSDIYKDAMDRSDNEIALIGTNYTVDDLMKLNIDVFRKGLEPAIFDSITTDGRLDRNKLVDVLPTLPLSDKTLLKMYITNATA